MYVKMSAPYTRIKINALVQAVLDKAFKGEM